MKTSGDAIASALAQANSLVVAIGSHADTAAAAVNQIEEKRLVAEKSRGEIDGQLTAMKEAVSSLQLQLDSAKLLIAEVANLHGNAQTTSNQTVEVKAQAAAALQSLQTLLGTATESANRIEAVKTSADQTQSVIATKSDHIEGGRVHADKVRGEIDRLFTRAQQSATNAEAQHEASQTALKNLNGLYASAQTVKATVDSNAQSVVSVLEECKGHATTTKALADIAEQTEERVRDYQQRLAELEKQSNELKEKIKTLLPSAASAGLAAAFHDRRAHFKWPQRIWQWVFVASVLALFGIAALEFKLFPELNTALTWDQLGLSLMHRLPFAAPIIWLAFHASGKSALAQRVEEDYGFKETVSRAFEGYRREMTELEGKASPQSAVLRLCEGVLSVITNPPGRIYEKHSLNDTPVKALAESAERLAVAAAKLTPVKLGE